MVVEHQLADIAQEENSAVGVTNLNLWILAKAESQGYSSLSMEEKAIVHVNALDWELVNRGVNRLIFGSDINFAEEMVACLRMVGAGETALLFQELLSLVPQYPLPVERTEREACFHGMTDAEIDVLGVAIQKLVDAKEDLFTQLCTYFESIRDGLSDQADAESDLGKAD